MSLEPMADMLAAKMQTLMTSSQILMHVVDSEMIKDPTVSLNLTVRGKSLRIGCHPRMTIPLVLTKEFNN